MKNEISPSPGGLGCKSNAMSCSRRGSELTSTGGQTSKTRLARKRGRGATTGQGCLALAPWVGPWIHLLTAAGIENGGKFPGTLGGRGGGQCRHPRRLDCALDPPQLPDPDVWGKSETKEWQLAVPLLLAYSQTVESQGSVARL